MEKTASEDVLKDLSQKYKTTLVVILAQIFTVVGLLVIAWFLAPKLDLPISAQATMALWILIFILIAGVFLLRRFLFNWNNFKQIKASKGLPEIGKTLQTYTILLGVLCVTVAFIGFLIASMSGNKFEMFRAGAVSLVGFFMVFPRKEIWVKIIQGIEKT